MVMRVGLLLRKSLKVFQAKEVSLEQFIDQMLIVGP